MNKLFTYFSVMAALTSIASCKSNIEPNKPSAGTVDFANYIALGNSLTAGYSDGSLYRSGQENSYPAMLAGQFKLVGGGTFNQPLLPGNAGWPVIPNQGQRQKRVLNFITDCLGNRNLVPVLYNGTIDTAGSAANIAAQGPFNNQGVPGIRCVDFVLPGYSLLNPYATRFYPQQAGITSLQLALASKPTFFSLWLGSNDVLGYATSGGEGNVNGIAIGDITPETIFKATYDMIVDSLVNTNAKGVLINIVDVTSAPYFTTINPQGLTLNANEVTQLNAYYANLNLSNITFSEGKNYFVTADEAGNIRKMTEGEYVLLSIPSDSIKCGGWGSFKPIPKRYVLSKTEVGYIQQATAAFNKIIADAATKHNLALVDAHSYLKTLKSGITWNGATYSPEFVTGGTFSLDGIHLTEKGYAIVANEIIRIINEHYQATLPLVDINKYNGVLFP